jgi:hypothetical protein
MEVSGPRVLCAITHALREPWVEILTEGQEKTWLTDFRPDGLTILHFHGTPVNKAVQYLDDLHEKIRLNHPYTSMALRSLEQILSKPWLEFIPNYIDSRLLRTTDRSLHIIFPDTYLTYRWKILGLFKYFIEQTADDYLFITTSSSYIRVAKLMEYVGELPKADVYDGGFAWTNAPFISGSNRILSRDVVSRLVQSRKAWRPGVIEDVELGNMVNKLGVNRSGKPLISIDSSESLIGTSDSLLSQNYHFRMKSGALQNRYDVSMMDQIHRRFKILDAKNAR